jgi:hypothetical protein
MDKDRGKTLRRKWGRDKEKRDNSSVKRWKEGDEREGA